MPDPSPAILAIEWGRITIEAIGDVKDAKLWPGGAREWDWRETGTHHRPGVQPADVAELIAGGATTIVLGIGMQRALGVCPETLDALRAAGIAVHVLQTADAVETYNRLAASLPVGGLIHSTC